VGSKLAMALVLSPTGTLCVSQPLCCSPHDTPAGFQLCPSRTPDGDQALFVKASLLPPPPLMAPLIGPWENLTEKNYVTFFLCEMTPHNRPLGPILGRSSGAMDRGEGVQV